MSRTVLASPAAHLSPASTARRAKRSVSTRPPQPRQPEDFFDDEALALLHDLLSHRARSWQRDPLPPVFFYGRDSEPQWGAYASVRCSGTTLRIAPKTVLYHGVAMDLERGLRLLTMTWTEKNTTTEGGHSAGEWRAALAGVLWRVGQHYREFVRRWGQERARDILRLSMEALWHNAPRRLQEAGG